MTAAQHLTIEALAAKWISSNESLSSRIMKGLQLVKAGAVEQLSPTLYRVKGSKGASYQVAKNYCECADHSFRADKGIRCAHRWAASLVAALAQQPAQVEFLTRHGLAA